MNSTENWKFGNSDWGKFIKMNSTVAFNSDFYQNQAFHWFENHFISKFDCQKNLICSTYFHS